MSKGTELATFAGGCFWCTEAIFKRVKGVISVAPGYTGGQVINPSYEQVSSETTGHAEAIQVEFDPAQTSYSTLLDIFWHTHDPTTLNRQGHDIGPQYRSAIFYHSPLQKKLAESSKAELEKAGTFKNPIVTEIQSFTKFYPAEPEHLDYYEQNPNAVYCSVVISPKIQKFLQTYRHELKPEFK